MAKKQFDMPNNFTLRSLNFFEQLPTLAGRAPIVDKRTERP
jgi:hypothetical protein